MCAVPTAVHLWETPGKEISVLKRKNVPLGVKAVSGVSLWHQRWETTACRCEARVCAPEYGAAKCNPLLSVLINLCLLTFWPSTVHRLPSMCVAPTGVGCMGMAFVYRPKLSSRAWIAVSGFWFSKSPDFMRPGPLRLYKKRGDFLFKLGILGLWGLLPWCFLPLLPWLGGL